MGSGGGSLLSAVGTIFSGITTANVKDVEAKQLRINAGETMASAEGAAAITRKKTELVQSAARASAGASGAGVTDTSVQNVQAETGRTGEYLALSQLFTGKAESNAILTQASLDDFAGQTALISAGIDALGELAGGQSPSGSGKTLGEEGMSMFEKYGAMAG